MKYKTKQYKIAENLINNGEIFQADKGGGIFKKKLCPFILMNARNNLFEQIADDVLEYFYRNKISWWGGQLTNHPLSSQIACINHLFFIREDKEAVLSLIQKIIPDVVDVLIITSDCYKPAYISFEAVSDIDHLNEKSSTRGSNCTSIDALVYGVHKDGRKILIPIEWKYVEVYGPENKATGIKGEVRKQRYGKLINQSTQLKRGNPDVYYYEPFYQLMRQTIWAEQIVAYRPLETLQVDDFVHIHVIPSNNKDLLNKVYSCSQKEMEETWRSQINNQHKYVIVSPKDLLFMIDRKKYQWLIEYLETRYWQDDYTNFNG